MNGTAVINDYFCGTQVSSLSGSMTGVSNGPVELNSTTDQLYTADVGGNVSIFAAESNGNTPPSAKLKSYSFCNYPSTLAIDSSGYLWVGQRFGGCYSGEILRFAPGAHGIANPVQIIQGSNTGLLSGPDGLAVDASGNVYCTDLDINNVEGIREWPPTANGNTAPTRVIAGSKTKLDSPTLGIAVDGNGRIIVANYYADNVEIFGANAQGNVAPVATISGSRTGLQGPLDVAVGGSNNIYVADKSNSILKFSSTANGNVAPISSISDPGGTFSIALCENCNVIGPPFGTRLSQGARPPGLSQKGEHGAPKRSPNN